MLAGRPLPGVFAIEALEQSRQEGGGDETPVELAVTINVADQSTRDNREKKQNRKDRDARMPCEGESGKANVMKRH